jgi:hypothetical protein
MLSGNVFEAMAIASATESEKRSIGPFVIPRILVEKLRVVG